GLVDPRSCAPRAGRVPGVLAEALAHTPPRRGARAVPERGLSGDSMGTARAEQRGWPCEEASGGRAGTRSARATKERGSTSRARWANPYEAPMRLLSARPARRSEHAESGWPARTATNRAIRVAERQGGEPPGNPASADDLRRLRQPVRIEDDL